MLLKNNINIDIEFFEPDGFDSGERTEYLKKRISFLNQTKSYDIVIASGTAAETFTEEQYGEFFSGIPAVFLGAGSNVHSEELSKKPGFYGFLKENFLSQTLSAAKKLFPDAKSYVAICDSSESGRENRELFLRKAKEFKAIRFSEINASAVTREQFRQELASVEKDSILFYMGAASDSDGNTYSAEEQADFIAGSTSLPVFSNNANGIGRGIIGGKMTDYEKAGIKAAETVLKIIRKEDTSSIKLQNLDEGIFLFDSKALEKYGLRTSRLPKGSLVVMSRGRQSESRRELQQESWELLQASCFLSSFRGFSFFQKRKNHGS